MDRAGHSTPNLRPVASRHRGLALFALAASGLVAVGVQYKRDSLRRNEQAQRDLFPNNLYVSVDRSGGGI